MRQLSPLDEDLEIEIDTIHNNRFATLLSVDDYIEEIVSMLSEANELENTFFLYTSDHGFQLGQHRLAYDKRHLYEHDIRIPMMIRGPNVMKNVTLESSIVLNIDVAPTLFDIMSEGSEDLPSDFDGMSFLDLITNDVSNQSWRNDFLISYHGQGQSSCGLYSCPRPEPFHENDATNNTYKCVRTFVSFNP